MYQISSDIDLLNDSNPWIAKLVIGETIITDEIVSVLLRHQSVSGSAIEIGGAYSACIDVSLYNPGINLDKKDVQLFMCKEYGEETIEIPMGIFQIENPKNDDGIIKFTAYDYIYSKLDFPCITNLTYPIDGKSVLSEMSTLLGINFNISNLPDGIIIGKRKEINETGYDDNGNSQTTTTYKNPFEGYTYAEELMYISQFYSKFAVAGRQNSNGQVSIEFRWYNDIDYSVDGDCCYDDMILEETMFTVEKLSCNNYEGTTLEAGTGEVTFSFENPVMTQEALNRIYNSIKSLIYLPASFSMFGDPRLDLGDTIKVTDKYGIERKFPIMCISQDYDGGITTVLYAYGKDTSNSDENTHTSPIISKLDRTYEELLYVKELVGNKASFDNLNAVNLYAKQLRADVIDGDIINANKIVTKALESDNANIKNLIAGKIDAEQIVADALESDNADIKNLIVESINGHRIKNSYVLAKALSDEALLTAFGIHVYYTALDPRSDEYDHEEIIDGDLWWKTVVADDDTNGEQLYEYHNGEWNAIEVQYNAFRANSITAQDIASNSITANEIATGTLTADKLSIDDLSAIGATIGGWTIDNNSLLFPEKTKITTSSKTNIKETTSDGGAIYSFDNSKYLYLYHNYTIENKTTNNMIFDSNQELIISRQCDITLIDNQNLPNNLIFETNIGGNQITLDAKSRTSGTSAGSINIHPQSGIKSTKGFTSNGHSSPIGTHLEGSYCDNGAIGDANAWKNTGSYKKLTAGTYVVTGWIAFSSTNTHSNWSGALEIGIGDDEWSNISRKTVQSVYQVNNTSGAVTHANATSIISITDEKTVYIRAWSNNVAVRTYSKLEVVRIA